MAERDLVVRIIGDDRDLQRAFTKTERRVGVFESRMTKVNQSLRGTLSGFGGRSALLFGSGAFVSTALLSTSIQRSITAASDLNEQIDRTRVILGDAADEVIAWSQTTAQSIGIAQRQALAANATFAGLFQTVGVAPQQASELSRSIVQLAADLASLQNTSPEDALIALRSGLVGESEPLRRYNIFLSEARVAQQAMSETGKKNARTLTDQEKALARYQIILRDSIPAQGNFALTSESLANQSRVLRANMDDLAANVGEVLVPALAEATQAANLLFIALDKFRGVDFTPGFDLPVGLKDLLLIPGISPAAGIFALGRVLGVGGDEPEKQIDEATKGFQGTVDAIERNREAAERNEREAKIAEVQLRRSQRAFGAFVKGMGLKLDRAQLTATLADDIAALRELERAILRQIQIEGRTFKLIELLTNARLQLSSLLARQAQDAADRARQAFLDSIDAMSLRLEMAETTKSLADDLTALRQIEQALLARIQAEGRTTELLRQLFQARQQQADITRRIAENQRARRQERQFVALGLTAEGERRVPSAGALRRRLGSLQDQIRGTVLDTPKTQAQLERIANVLSGQFGKVGRDVRAAIQQMFRDISEALEGGGGDRRLTQARKIDINRLLANMGLSEQEIRELRSRLSQFTTASPITGTTGGRRGLPPATATAGFGGGLGGALIVNVYVDGQKVEAAVTKRQQRNNRRRGGSRSGTNPGGQR